jgi:hypothetical protein
MPWFGWGKQRKGDEWRRLCGPFDTLAECSRQLAEEGQQQGIPGHLQVMTTGAAPRDPGDAARQPARCGEKCP